MQSKTPLAKLLLKKNLPDQNLFDKLYPIQLKDPIALHAKWAFTHIYSIPYPETKNDSSKNRNSEVARKIHGIQHTSRVAMYALVFGNLYRRHRSEEAKDLSEEDIHLLQIAALFHDAARENEGRDLWDHESAILLYYYLRKILKVGVAKAKLIAEATANKDWKTGGNYFTIDESDVEIDWNYISSPLITKNIYQKIIHDADCLDIIRARSCFQASYLDFYKHIAKNNSLAFEEMSHLIIEARSLIHLQGDSFGRINLVIKQEYEHQDAYIKILNAVARNPSRFPLLYQLSQDTVNIHSAFLIPPIPPYDEKLGMTERNVQSALQEGKLFVRAVASPSAIMAVHSKKTAAQVELEKTYRTIGIPTPSKKTDRMNKQGNDHRSVSVIFATPAFADAGFLDMLDQSNKKIISNVSSTDWGSGRGKKKSWNNLNKEINIE